MSRDSREPQKDLIQRIKSNPTIQGFLREHRRYESLPRKACPNCQFEYNEEDKHVCR